MKILSLEECQRDLAALDAADKLTSQHESRNRPLQRNGYQQAHEKSHGNVDGWQLITGGARASRQSI